MTFKHKIWIDPVKKYIFESLVQIFNLIRNQYIDSNIYLQIKSFQSWLKSKAGLFFLFCFSCSLSHSLNNRLEFHLNKSSWPNLCFFLIFFHYCVNLLTNSVSVYVWTIKKKLFFLGMAFATAELCYMLWKRLLWRTLKTRPVMCCSDWKVATLSEPTESPELSSKWPTVRTALGVTCGRPTFIPK